MLPPRSWLVSLAAALFILTHAGSGQSPAGSPALVVSQVYGGGGNTSAPLNADFIEIYNRGSEPASLGGLSLQYASATGTGQLGSPGITRLPDVLLAPGAYFLVREASGFTGAPLPQPFYAAGSPILMSATGGKVALVRGTASLGCNGGSTPCSAEQRAHIIDLVGYGDADFFEGSGTALGASSTLAVLRTDAGHSDTDDNRSDFASGSPTPRNTGNAVALSIGDVTVAEGDAVNPVARFMVSLNNPALSPVTFTIETVDESATAGFDYVAQPAQTLAIAVGERTGSFDVTILADTVIEPDETFAVVVRDVVGVAVADARGIGTIQNDDLPFLAIHELQGAGATSPHAGERVATTGIVTALKSNGYFMQTPDGEADAEPDTSQGIFVFTGFPPSNPNNPAQVAAFNNRLAKASLAIRTVLRTPDILGLIEVGDIHVLRALGDRLNAGAGTSYEAYLLESDDDTENDQDVGYLVNPARVTVTAQPVQAFEGVMFELCGATDTLFDRPPFILEADFQGMPVTVVLNHLRSLIDISANTTPFLPPPCTETPGSRVREKRRLGAEHLADLIESRQGENLVVIGDMNAFEFSDGYVDVLGTLQGSPAPADEVVEPSADRWDHTLVNLVTRLPADERYSFVFGGSAQVLDHVLVNQAMLDRLTRFAWARLNADFPAGSTADPTAPERLSDHDAPVGYFAAAANLTTATDVPAVVTSGTAFTSQMSVANAGPDAARDVTLTNVLPENATLESVLAPDGWSCAAADGGVTCEAASLGASDTARFTVLMTAVCAVADGRALSSSTTAASPTERETARGDNASSDDGTIANPAPVISDAAVDTPVLLRDGRFHLVRVSYSIADNCGPLRTRLFVQSNEESRGDSTLSEDWVVLSEHGVLLRATDSGAKRRRTYTVLITTKDSAGNVATESVTVAVERQQQW